MTCDGLNRALEVAMVAGNNHFLGRCGVGGGALVTGYPLISLTLIPETYIRFIGDDSNKSAH